MMVPEQYAADMRKLAQGFFDAVGEGDMDAVAACYDDDVVIWHNFDGREKTKAENLATLAAMPSRLDERVYADRRVEIFDGGFVHQHVLTARRKLDGVQVRLPAIIICRVRDGKIVRLDEYLDSAHVAEFRKGAA